MVLSKRSGLIFREVEALLDSASTDFLHIGDALLGDVVKPREAGWESLHFPVSVNEARTRAEDLEIFVEEMKNVGLDVSDWAKV